jgi:Ca-activated chloride channel family protein
MNLLKGWMLVPLLSWGVMGSPVSAQSSMSEGLPRGFRFETSVDAVHLSVSVVNRKGRVVTDLDRKDFRVLEDGVPQDITFFSRGTDSPVDILLLVDASGSMDVVSKVVNARNAALQLIHSLGPEDRVAVHAFDAELSQLCPFTTDKRAAIDAVQRLEPFGATALYDAVAKASYAVEHEGFGRRAIVVLTDGIDTASELPVEQALAMAKQVDLPVFAIRVLSPLDDPGSKAFLGVHGSRATGPDILRQFAQNTGGRLYEGSELGVLRRISTRIKEELKTQYRLGYSPTNRRKDGRFRRIEVLTGRRDVEVRTRKGYFANPRGGSGAETRTSFPDAQS